MILDLGSATFHVTMKDGGGTPSWGTDMGQGVGYRFSFEDHSSFIEGLVYKSINDIDHISCPLGKGGNKQMDYEYVVASVFEKIYVNGKQVKDASFILLVVKKIRGENHVGRRTLKYNPRITYNGEPLNKDCYIKIAETIEISDKSAWFISEINIVNQDELHFTAYVLNEDGPIIFNSTEERKNAMKKVLPEGTRYKLSICNQSYSALILDSYRQMVTAIKTKPFLLLAGISGTGKSRIVRELARSCWEVGSEEYKAQKPMNFEMVQVKPNWHDSSELLGYVSRIGGEDRFVVGPFLRFLAKAISHPDIPFFLCLDEMNLAPVEQYFAEYLSVIESRKVSEDGVVVTDPIVDFEPTNAYHSLITQLFPNDDEERAEYLKEESGKRLTIPSNLIVVGTVNMDETTFSFSRKVLDRAMTIEMNEVNLWGGLEDKYELIGKQSNATLIGGAVEGVDVYSRYKEVCDTCLNYLSKVNNALEGTPFKIAYRTRNEVLLYVVNNLPYNQTESGDALEQKVVIARALDEITNMKILSRIEGDESKKTEDFLNSLSKVINDELSKISEITYGAEAKSNDEGNIEKSISLAKLEEMKRKLTASGYTSYWS